MQFKALRKLVEGKEALPTLLFPEDVVRIMESGEASDLEITSFEIQAVGRGMRDHRIWKRRDDHYDSVCWRMEEREFQCQWFPEGDYLIFTERTPPTAHECGWTPDHIVTFSHPPQGRTMSDIVALEEGIISLQSAPAVDAHDPVAFDTSETKQFKLQMESSGSLGNAIATITDLVGWWFFEHFGIASRKTSLAYNLRFMDIVHQMVADSFTRKSR